MNDNQKILQEANRYNNYLKQLDNISNKLKHSKYNIENKFSGNSRNALLNDLDKLYKKSRSSEECSMEMQRRLKRLSNDVRNQEREGQKK